MFVTAVTKAQKKAMEGDYGSHGDFPFRSLAHLAIVPSSRANMMKSFRTILIAKYARYSPTIN